MKKTANITHQKLTVLKEYMTLDDMAEYFNLDKKSIYNWERNGLKTIQLSTRLKFYKADDVREYLEQFNTGERNIR